MKVLSKALVGTVAAGAMAVSAATPAFADHRDGDRDGISAGEIIAGALIIGGIAAVVSAGNRDRGYDGDYRYGRAGYGGSGRDGYYGGNPRQAIEQCVRTAEREASRRGYRANVTDVRDIDRTRYGFQVKGRIAVDGQGRGGYGDQRYGDGRYGDQRYGDQRYGDGRYGDQRYGDDNHDDDGRYGSGWGGDYRGWDNSVRGYDSGSFKCRVERGRVVDLDFGGIRGL